MVGRISHPQSIRYSETLMVAWCWEMRWCITNMTIWGTATAVIHSFIFIHFVESIMEMSLEKIYFLKCFFWYFRCCYTQGTHSVRRGGEGGGECCHCSVGSDSGWNWELNCRPLPAALPHLHQRCSTSLQEHGWARSSGNQCLLSLSVCLNN